MKHEEVYNIVRAICGSVLMVTLFMMPSCSDDRVEEPLEENIQMYVNGSEIIPREYYESVTTYGASSVQEDGSIKKIFVLHFQREDGRVTPEKEHYALIMYDNNGQDNGQLIDTKLYLGGTQMDSLLLQTTSGRITLEIVGLSDFTEFMNLLKTKLGFNPKPTGAESRIIVQLPYCMHLSSPIDFATK